MPSADRPSTRARQGRSPINRVQRPEARDVVLDPFSAYRAETQLAAEYALVLAVVAIVAVAAFTFLKPLLDVALQDVAQAL